MISMIVATSKNNYIGINNQLPWHIKEDLQYFKKTTTGKTIIMGRKTFESIGKPLPNRTNIVLTHNKDFVAPGVQVIHSIEEAFTLFPQNEEVFIIGGGQIYESFLPYADKLYITLVGKSIHGDTCFPAYQDDFKLVEKSPVYYNEESQLSYQFTTWER